MPGAKATQCKWLTPEQILEATTDELKIVYANAEFHMSDMQRKLVKYMLEGEMSDADCAYKAGYRNKARPGSTEYKKSKKVVHALRIGREIMARESEATAEWFRAELRELLQKAKDEGDHGTITRVLQEFAKLHGFYATEQLKLLHAGHDGNALDREISDDEWDLISHLHHEVRADEDGDTRH